MFFRGMESNYSKMREHFVQENLLYQTKSKWFTVPKTQGTYNFFQYIENCGIQMILGEKIEKSIKSPFCPPLIAKIRAGEEIEIQFVKDFNTK